MYELNDTFNRTIISKHRTLKAAVEAMVKHSAAVRKHNGSGSYIPKSITKNREPLDDYEADEVSKYEYTAGQ